MGRETGGKVLGCGLRRFALSAEKLPSTTV
jgi:hypothetical protein